MDVDTPVVIVGAGLAGLVTAWELTCAGIPCQVLEASHRAGGRVETAVFADGLTAEAHMEEFWQSSPAYPLLNELGLDLLEDCAHSSVILDGRLSPYRGDCDRDAYLSGMFTEPERRAWLRWNDHARRLLVGLDPSPQAETPLAARALMAGRFSAYVRQHVPEHRVAEWIRIVVESETAVEWDRISVLDGVAELEPFLDTPAGFGETNAHVQGGNQGLIDALLRRLPDGTVCTREPVRSVRDVGGGVLVSHGPGLRPTLTRCDQVVITVPAWSRATIELDARLEPAAVEAIRTRAAGSYVKVLLRLRPEAARLWEGYGAGLFTLLSDSPAGCVYLGDAPEGHDLILTQLVHAQHARPLCLMPEAEVVRRTVAALDGLSGPAPLWPGVGALVTESRVYAYPTAVAYWPVDRGRSRYDEPARALRRPQGRVHFAGDTLESSHSDGAVRSGQRVARTLTDRLAGAVRPEPSGSGELT